MKSPSLSPVASAALILIFSLSRPLAAVAGDCCSGRGAMSGNTSIRTIDVEHSGPSGLPMRIIFDKNPGGMAENPDSPQATPGRFVKKSINSNGRTKVKLHGTEAQFPSDSGSNHKIAPLDPSQQNWAGQNPEDHKTKVDKKACPKHVPASSDYGNVVPISEEETKGGDPSKEMHHPHKPGDEQTGGEEKMEGPPMGWGASPGEPGGPGGPNDGSPVMSASQGIPSADSDPSSYLDNSASDRTAPEHLTEAASYRLRGAGLGASGEEILGLAAGTRRFQITGGIMDIVQSGSGSSRVLTMKAYRADQSSGSPNFALIQNGSIIKQVQIQATTAAITLSGGGPAFAAGAGVTISTTPGPGQPIIPRISTLLGSRSTLNSKLTVSRAEIMVNSPGSGLTPDGMRVERSWVSVRPLIAGQTTYSDERTETYLETIKIGNSAVRLVKKTETVFRTMQADIGWEEIVSQKEWSGPNNTPQTTYYYYYPVQQKVDGQTGVLAADNYASGELKLVVRPNGAWQAFQVDQQSGEITAEYSPWLNSPPPADPNNINWAALKATCRCVAHEFDAQGRASADITTILNEPVAKTVYSYGTWTDAASKTCRVEVTEEYADADNFMATAHRVEC